MITTSTNHVEGYKVRAYLGIQTASSVFSDKKHLARLKEGCEDKLDTVYQETLKELAERASFLGGDAVVGIRSSTIVPYPGIAYLQLSGTVVQLEAIDSKNAI